jgi:phosphoribosyl-AMP cyclohydrolase / phosphoribosyl-ATP pyrophosphohydrolase
MKSFDLAQVDFNKGNGLVPVVAQDDANGLVLMLGYANREALEETLRSGELTFFSRTKGRLWKKGETSGNVLTVRELLLDCDRDTVLARVTPHGPTCHTGSRSCFGEEYTANPIARLDSTIAQRASTPPGSESRSYTHKLLSDRNLRLKKLGEEVAELLMALADKDSPRIAEEAADLTYHMLVALHAEGVTLEDVQRVLQARVKGP